jgi:hypothetical protein
MCSQRITAAVTGPPPKNYGFRIRVIDGSGSPLCPADRYQVKVSGQYDRRCVYENIGNAQANGLQVLSVVHPIECHQY